MFVRLPYLYISKIAQHEAEYKIADTCGESCLPILSLTHSVSFSFIIKHTSIGNLIIFYTSYRSAASYKNIQLSIWCVFFENACNISLYSCFKAHNALSSSSLTGINFTFICFVFVNSTGSINIVCNTSHIFPFSSSKRKISRFFFFIKPLVENSIKTR